MKKVLFREDQILLSRRSAAAATAELGLSAKFRRIRTKTTIASAANRYYVQDLMRRNFSAASPGAFFVGNITYIRTTAGFIYLATVIDCFLNAVVGWAIDDSKKTSLVIKAVEIAQRRMPIIPGKTILHADRGSQHSSGDFRDVLEHPVTRSPSRKDGPEALLTIPWRRASPRTWKPKASTLIHLRAKV